MNKTVVINVVGLTRRLIGDATPRIKAFLEAGDAADIAPVLPGVTCTAQSTYLTGKLPKDHGIVGNGWYFKTECEVKFWRQSNRLVQGRKIWEVLKEKDPAFTCANMFWWYNMYSTVDYSVTPRPNYLADGRKIPDSYSFPPELRDELQDALGQFPLFHFWGPKTTIRSSQWIADASVATDRKYDPTLTLIYLPHLDYNLQRYGLDFSRISKDLSEIDQVVGGLIDHYQHAGVRIILLSEYGITDVDRPVHLNRVFRKLGWLGIRRERGLELLDAGASEVFAVADHQIAHIYLKDPSKTEEVRKILEEVPGVGEVLSGDGIREAGLAHSRCGDLVAVADERSWFTYYYWEDDAVAPDFARTVDIHKKPGYDPVELFTDPADPLVIPKVALKLLRKKMGFRTVMDLIPLKAELVRGSHGRIPEDSLDYPIFITNQKLPELTTFRAQDVYDLILKTVSESVD
ncbi:Predicted pyrophosphatase or phosphodiesterase, AlkP superfamily [Robiginitalea myxolifaciens]|uniref:Predicted pyrophosphatase or phosphodiesterase, AlkP superfamily n=1 Tax=Robiginitalea myxolifaciens TaxID=400055 RepID=A0A1I6H3N3_9FLAO|nr:nucleotide pyrophosphatase/phosphodiesterase family protein [Robiginitalea myxolifaciens]SFR49075.1 Predicted pyrophosphatase or phosphodiesterase, AlkP superfamily [Robiginitalea myxolifaciens]